jgi:hypothetical protein
MAYDWKKNEKQFYLPKSEPVRIDVPAFRFFTVQGSGNPNDEAFGAYIQVLYALSYAVKMSPKKGLAPEGYFDYTIYPLEGVWDISDKAKQNPSAKLDKNELVFKLMIRQPDFVTPDYALQTLERVKKSKPHPLLDTVLFESIQDGPCVQMLHVGSYDNEPENFRLMEAFASDNGWKRASKIHREIYLSDARKTDPKKLKTVLRFKLELSL